MVRALGVIPARFGSTRFPGKPLAPLGGKPLVERVWLQARRARRIERIVIATEDERVAEACARFGAEVVLTSERHASGTDRVAEVARERDGSFAVIVNVQGDEPFVTPSSLDRLVEAFEQAPPPAIATLAEPIAAVDEIFDPNVVKVVTADDGRALYFSRSPIPYVRGGSARLGLDFREALAASPDGLGSYRKHQGIYAYRRDALLYITGLRPSVLERAEGLEQLRALQAGFDILVLESDFRSLAVDTPADLERAEALLQEATG